jgi:hypothetical protein
VGFSSFFQNFHISIPSLHTDIYFSHENQGNQGILIQEFRRKKERLLRPSLRLPQAATFDCMPGVLAVIAHPDTRFCEEVNIGMFAQGAYNSGIFPFLVVYRFHGSPHRERFPPLLW